MNKKSHIITTSIVLIAFWLIFRFIFKKEYFTFTLVIASIPICLYNDIDTSIPAFGHRNFAFHSIIIWVIIFYFNQSFMFILFIFTAGLHDLCDIRFCSRKRVGFYTIKVWMRPSLSLFDKENKQNIIVWKTLFGLNGAWSTLYLILNFLIGCVFLIAWLVVF